MPSLIDKLRDVQAENRKKQEDEQREEERKAKALAAAEVVAVQREQEQAAARPRQTPVVTRTPDVSTPVQKATERAIVPASSYDTVYRSPEPKRQEPGDNYANGAATQQPQSTWRRTYQQQAAQPLGPTVRQEPKGPVEAVQQWWAGSEPQREQAVEMYQARRDEMSQGMRNFSLQAEGKGPVQGYLGNVAKWSDNLGVPTMLNALNLPFDYAAGLTVPGTELTVGQAVGAGLDAFGTAADRAISERVANEQAPGYTPLGSVGQNTKILFDSFADIGSYWQDEVDAMQAGVTPTPEQLDRSNPEQIAEARAIARFAGWSGADAVTKSFDQYLDNPVQGEEMLQQSALLAQQAYTLPDGPEQQAMLLQAGKLKAEAVRLQDVTPLEIYNENSVWWRELAAGLVFDPLNAVGLVGDVGKAIGLLPGGISPMGRRFAGAQAVAEMAEDAAMGANQGPLGRLFTSATDIAKTGISKAMTASMWNWSTVNQVTANLHTKGDVIAGIAELVTNPKGLAELGIDVTRLNGPNVALESAGGFFRVGWSSIKNAEYQKASKVMQQPGFLDAVATLPSLRGAGGEMVDKNQFMSDMHGLLGRWSGWQFKVSAMDNVPYGAKAVRMAPSTTTPGMQVIEFLDGKDVIKTSIEMTAADAAVGFKNAERNIKRGEEYRKNTMTMVADFERQLFSATAINSVPSSIIQNILGGIGMGLINLEDPRMFQKVSTHLAYVMGKTGGMFPDLRIATGAGNLPGPAGLNVSSKGYWRGSDVINKIFFGLPELGRKFRTNTEEGMAAMVYGTAFRRGYEEGAERLSKNIEAVVGRFTQDKRIIKTFTDQLTQAVVSGNRSDVARVAADLASGRGSISVRSLSTAFPEVLGDAYAMEIDGLLRSMDETNMPQVSARIADIFQERMSDALTEVETGVTVPKRYFWTQADRIKDRSENFTHLQNLLRKGHITQQEYDVLVPTMKQTDAMATEMDGNLFAFLQMAQGRPDTIPLVYGTWLKLQQSFNDLRAWQGQMTKNIADRLDEVARDAVAAGVPYRRNAPIPLAGQPAVMAVEDLVEREKGLLWRNYYQTYTDEAKTAGAIRLDIINDAWKMLDDGTYINLQPLAGDTLRTFFKSAAGPDLQADVEQLHGLKMSFKDDVDPRLWDQMVEGQRAVTDQFVARMFAALQRNPSMDAMDEYMSAIKYHSMQVGMAASGVKKAFEPITDLQLSGQQVPKQLWDVARAARLRWQVAHRNSWEMMQSATVRMLESSMLDEVTAPLRFEYRGVKFRLAQAEGKNKYRAFNENTGKLVTLHSSIVPATAQAALPNLKTVAERVLTEQFGQLARQAGVQGVGIPEIDKMITAVTKSPFNDHYNQVKQNVAKHIMDARPTVVVPDKMGDYMMDTLGAAQYALQRALPEILAMKKQGYGAFGPGFVSAINQEILPRIDNLLTGADRAGKSAVSVSLVDYVNNYWPDVLLSTFVPYHFWFTRMAKNSLEQAIFNPKITANMSRLYSRVYWENQQNNVPQRNAFQIPGLQVGETDDAYIGMDVPFARWIPILPLMVQNGWADPDRANAAYEYLSEAQEEGGWPGSRKAILGNTILAAEIAKRFGVSSYPWVDAGLAQASGKRVETNLASMGPIFRGLGWGSVKFAEWLKEQGMDETAGLVDAAGSTMRPFYEPYLVGRQASLNAQRGLLSDVEAQNVQDVGYQRFFDAAALPEQLPQAEGQYSQARQQVSSDYMLRQFLQWVLPMRFTSTYKGEQELAAAQDLKRNMGYDPGIASGGSKAAQTAMYAATPGLSARSSQYAVTGESAPQVPDPNAVRPGIRAAQAQFYPQREAIYDQYGQQIEDAYAKHPEWATAGGASGKGDITDPLFAARKAEIEGLEAAFPSIQGVEGAAPNSPSKLAGTNPQEARVIAIAMALKMAQEENAALDPGPYPSTGGRAAGADWRDQKAAYDSAVTASLNRLMAQPGIGSELVPGRELPGGGVQAPYQASPYAAQIGRPVSRTEALRISQDTLRRAEEERLPTSVATAQEPVSNPWSAEMQAAEQQYGLPTGILSRIAQQESGFNPQAKSPAGAQGLMQFMPATWADAQKAIGVTDINDPVQSVQAAGWYVDWIRQQLPPEKQGMEWVLAAYNGGIGRAQKAATLGDMPAESQAYVSGVLGGQSLPQTTPQVGGWTPPGTQTQGFGENPDVYKQWGFAGHEGVDYGTAVGTPVAAAAGGTVKHAGPAAANNANYGTYIVIDHGDGKETWYAHLDTTSVKVGQKVAAGEAIGGSGNTGNSTGPHLHFAVRDTAQMGSDTKGFIDPQVWLNGMQQGLPTPAGVNLRAPVMGEGQPAPSPNGIDWGTSAGQVVQGDATKFKGPNQLAADQAVQQQYANMDSSIAAAYPDYVGIKAQWDRTEDADRAAFKKANPEITAVNFLAWNPDAWKTVEQQFGDGIILAWARKPDSESGDRPAYYHKNPGVFQAGAWITGRPQPRTEDGTQDKDFSYNLGADYEEAKKQFGAGIWDKVGAYWAIPPTDKKARSQFFKDNPDYAAWNEWWYANLPDLPSQQKAGYGYGGFSSSYSRPEPQERLETHAPSPYRRSYDLPEAPKYQAPSSMGSDWRQWLALGETNLRNWRR